MNALTILTVLQRCGRLRTLVWAFVVASTFLLPLRAESPTWWDKRGVLTGAPPDDYAVLNQGQLKNLAAKAAAEMNVQLPDGAGTAVNAAMLSWSSEHANPDDFAAATVGQLKALAALFYQRLSLPYPWTAAGGPSDDYALANIGQAKKLFSFAIAFTPPQEWYDWLVQQGLSSSTPINGPSGEAGLTNWKKFKATVGDEDGDGVPDAAEVLVQTDPSKKDNPLLNLVARGYAIP